MATSASTLGTPAILDPRDFDLRAFQSSIRNIRERFRNLDAAVSTLQTSGNTSAMLTQVANLQQQLAALAFRVSTLESALGVADTVSVLMDDAVDVGMPVAASTAGRGRLADPSDPTSIYGLIGLATNAAAAGQTAAVQYRGVLSIPGAAFDAQQAVYVGVGGELLQHPTYGSVALPVGVAVSSTAVWVAPGAPSLLVSNFDPEYERFLPATVQLVTDALDLATQFGALPDGLFVKVGDGLMPRALVEGPGIWIDNADGAEGNPTIRAVAADAVRVRESTATSDSASAVLGP